MKVVIYDCEIKKAILGRKDDVLPNIEYCNGWRDFQGMGISVATAYDYHADQYRIFCDDNMPEFKILADSSDLIVGYNSNQFDDNLMAFNHVPIDIAKTYDILQEIWEACGCGKVEPPHKPFIPRTHGGYTLDAVCEVNLGLKKSGHGALAPVDWQRGKIGTTIDYGLRDTWLTKKVFDLIIDTGTLIDPKSGKKIHLRPPLES